jgi:antitoxin (DNA-binding transcriptional repressor) of toxin-antitoxin stability system
VKYTIPEASKNLSRLLRKACAGEDVVIVVDEDLQVKLVPVRDEVPDTTKDRRLGCSRGKSSVRRTLLTRSPTRSCRTSDSSR